MVAQPTTPRIETLKCIGVEVERLAREIGFRVVVGEDAALRLVERHRDPLPAQQAHPKTHRSKARGRWTADPAEVRAWFLRQRFQILTDDYPRARGIDS